MTESESTEITVPGTEVALSLFDLKAQIATELAAGLSDAEGIRQRYGISIPQWDVLRENPSFRNMVVEALEKLQGDLNAGKRITLKSEIALEDSIQELYVMAHDPRIVPASRIEAIKTMAQLAGRNAKEGSSGPAGSGFSINISFSAESGEPKGVIIDSQALAQPT
jgi:hypothetical protein